MDFVSFQEKSSGQMRIAVALVIFVVALVSAILFLTGSGGPGVLLDIVNGTNLSGSTSNIGPGTGGLRASFSYTPESPAAGESVSFDASTSSSPDSSIVRYEWDFDGDGRFETTGETVRRSFGSGEKTVTLRVTDEDDNTDTESKNIDIQ